MNKPINELVEKWEKTGLLQELSDSKKINCAKSLEEMAQLLLKKDKQLKKKSKHNSFIQSFGGELIPIVRKLYNENLKKMPSAKYLYDDYTTVVIPDRELYIVTSYVNNLTSHLKNN